MVNGRVDINLYRFANDFRFGIQVFILSYTSPLLEFRILHLLQEILNS